MAEPGKVRVLAAVLRGGCINISPWMNANERTQDQQLKREGPFGPSMNCS